MKTMSLYIHKCKRCNGKWASKSKSPLRCSKYKTPYWKTKPKKKKAKDS